MARRIQLTDSAAADELRIWLDTAKTYDLEQADRYQTLLEQSYEDIQQDPERLSSQKHPELGVHVRSYHINLSKGRSGTGIKKPRHFVFYTLEHEDRIEVLRILHDRMDPSRHIEEEAR